MAYRKTAKVKAHLKAQREAILDSSFAVLARVGRSGFTSTRVIEHAGISMGLLYRYFADVDELWAAVVASALARDVAAIREAAEHRYPANAFARAIAAIYETLDKPRLARALADAPAYRRGIRRELEALLAALAMPARTREQDAAGVLGALYGLAEAGASTRAAQTFALRALGIPEPAARAIPLHG